MFKSIKKAATVVVATSLTAPAFADGSSSGGVSDIFAAVDLSSVVGFVTTAGVTIIGINLGMKGITLAKRALNKA